MTSSIPLLFADQYEVVRELGSGGMATVYLARDRRLDRLVALKVIHRALGDSIAADRFRREVAFTARLQHPHLVPVFDTGATDGLLWFAMRYVEGESLRDRLRRELQLPVADAVRIAREVADALAYAHGQGVVHRDVKPENILLDRDGRALLADFGIARGLDPANGETSLTATGMSLGTPAYMSPEQAVAERAPDARSDVYALGCVLYEMLAGEPPFTGPTAQAVIAKRFAVTPTSLCVVRATVPPALDAEVARAMARAPADRFQTAAAFAEALASVEHQAATGASTAPRPAPTLATPASPRRRLLLGALAAGVLAVAAAAAVVLTRGAPGARGRDAAASIAVLPFDNVGEAPEAAFADAVADEIRGKLAALPALHVIASTSSAKFRGATVPDREIARALGVRYLVRGKVRWGRGRPGERRLRVRVDPELVQVSGVPEPTSRWAESIEGTTEDVFALESEIATRVAEKLGVVLAVSDSARLNRVPTNSGDAYEAYLRGRAIVASQGTVPAALRAATTEYEKAVGLDSGYALAWAAMGSTLSMLHSVSAAPDPTVAERAQAAVSRAEALAPTIPDVFRARGMFLSRVLKDQRRALDAYRTGLRLAPRDVQLLSAAAMTHLALGSPDSAGALLRAAQQVDPLAPQLASNRLQAALRVHDVAEARAAGDRALSLQPASLSVRQYRAMAELQDGRLDAARAIVAGAPATVSRTALVAYMANYQDLFWVLDDAQQRDLLALAPADFDGDRGSWGLALASTWALRGDSARASAYADSARQSLDEQLRGSPQSAVLHAAMALALAYRDAAGDAAEAVRHGELAATLAPLDQDLWIGSYVRYELARVYARTGAAARATEQLAQLLRLPYVLTPGWLRVDPAFAPLRGTPAFAALVRG